jgi:Helix-turn-helix domain
MHTMSANETKNTRGPDLDQQLQSRRELARRRSEWMRLVIRDPDLPAGVKLLLVTIALYMSKTKHRAWPSQQTLAEQTDTSDRQVRRNLQVAEEAAYLDIDHNTGGSFYHDDEMRGRPNYYYLRLPEGASLDDSNDDDDDLDENY